jgi:hypothetical protein
VADGAADDHRMRAEGEDEGEEHESGEQHEAQKRPMKRRTSTKTGLMRL